MRKQELAGNEGSGKLAKVQNGENRAGELARNPWGTTPLPPMGYDLRDSEYFTKNPVSPPRSTLTKTGRKSRGQPTKLGAGQKKMVACLVSLGFSLRQIATYLYIDHSTISRAKQRDGDFAAALARAKEERSLHPQLGFRGWRSAWDVLQRIEAKRRG